MMVSVAVFCCFFSFCFFVLLLLCFITQWLGLPQAGFWRIYLLCKELVVDEDNPHIKSINILFEMCLKQGDIRPFYILLLKKLCRHHPHF